MKKGFTLLEIIIVIIIIGILATLGFTQYSKMVERSRGAEAKAIVGDIRKFAAAARLELGTVPATGAALNDKVNIGTGSDMIPSSCTTTHYFSYSAAQSAGGNGVAVTATRCGATGKSPSGGPSTGQTYILTSDFVTGNDVVSGNGSY